jgi:EpsI family protein
MRELTHAVLAACLMMAGSLLAQALTPTIKLTQQLGEPRFITVVPAQLGPWGNVEDDLGAVLDPQTLQPDRKLNSEVLKRIYANSSGERVMVLLAYAPELGPTLHAYRPEACYPAQGWAVSSQRSDEMALQEGQLPLRRLETARDAQHREAVSYWTLIGSHASRGALHNQLLRMEYSSHNLEPDGLVMRISSPVNGDPATAFALHDDFLRALVTTLKPDARERLVGLPNPQASTGSWLTPAPEGPRVAASAQAASASASGAQQVPDTRSAQPTRP